MKEAMHSRFQDYEFEFFVQGLKLTLMRGFVELDSEDASKQGTPLNMLHGHAWYELFYVPENELRCFVQGKEVTLKPGEMLLISPNELHYTDLPSIASRNNGCYSLQFSLERQKKSSLMPEIENIIKAFEDIKGYYRFTPSVECMRAMTLLHEALSEKQSLLAEAYFWVCLLHICHKIYSGNSMMKGMPADNTVSRAYKLDALFRDGFRQGASLEDFASELRVSKRQLSRIIQKQYGCSFQEKIKMMRMECAVHFLLSTDKTVSRIADEVGYSSVSNFYRMFLQTYGCLPTEYRKQNRTTKGD